ncbi:hypothetical protein BC828DRAFT_399958 [Blastocladiella britannica]|nr:hypothetical protein BC828DRAFT_399958 [Blastocladiella britannica]
MAVSGPSTRRSSAASPVDWIPSSHSSPVLPRPRPLASGASSNAESLSRTSEFALGYRAAMRRDWDGSGIHDIGEIDESDVERSDSNNSHDQEGDDNEIDDDDGSGSVGEAASDIAVTIGTSASQFRRLHRAMLVESLSDEDADNDDEEEAHVDLGDPYHAFGMDQIYADLAADDMIDPDDLEDDMDDQVARAEHDLVGHLYATRRLTLSGGTNSPSGGSDDPHHEPGILSRFDNDPAAFVATMAALSSSSSDDAEDDELDYSSGAVAATARLGDPFYRDATASELRTYRNLTRLATRASSHPTALVSLQEEGRAALARERARPSDATERGQRFRAGEYVPGRGMTRPPSEASSPAPSPSPPSWPASRHRHPELVSTASTTAGSRVVAGSRRHSAAAAAIAALSTAAPRTREATPEKERHKSVAALDDLLKCFICFGTLERAVMCPSCSKMGCEFCMQRWITQERPECPHCRTHLYVSQLVQCRFVDELQAQIRDIAEDMDAAKATAVPHEKKPSSQAELCAAHKAPLYYYCNTCKDPLCSDCAMFGDLHRGHDFVHLEKVHAARVAEIEAAVVRIKLVEIELVNVVAEAESRMAGLESARLKTQEEVQHHVTLALEHVNEEVRAYATSLFAFRDQVESHIEVLTKASSSILSETKTLPAAALVGQAEELLARLASLESPASPLPIVSSVPTLPALANPLLPSYATSEVVIPSFSDYAATGQVFHSPLVVAGGITWRLKVYPHGSPRVRGRAVSIFVELVAGLEQGESVEYQYKIEIMVHPPPSVPATSTSLPSTPTASPPSSPPSTKQAVSDSGVAVTTSVARQDSGVLTSPSVSGATSGSRRVDGTTPTPARTRTRTVEAAPTAATTATTQERADRTRTITTSVERDFTSRFAVGDSWGSGDFYPRWRLERDGLLAANGTMTLRFHVRPLTFAQRCADLDRYARAVAAENSDLKARLGMIEARTAVAAATAASSEHSTAGSGKRAESLSVSASEASGVASSNIEAGSGKAARLHHRHPVRGLAAVFNTLEIDQVARGNDDGTLDSTTDDDDEDGHDADKRQIRDEGESESIDELVSATDEDDLHATVYPSPAGLLTTRSA